MLDFSSKQFQSSLSDAVVWCRMKSQGADGESEDVRRRQALYMQAKQNFQEAQHMANRRWFPRKIGDTKPWRDAMAVLQHIRDTVGSVDPRQRSPELKPSFGLDEFGRDAPWAKAVAEVVAKRSLLTAEVSAGKDDANVGGRLLLYNPTENLACGAAEVSSNGFFDVNNVPPWDIWVHFSEGTLVSWVPPDLLDVAEMGIDVNPEGCIRWAD